jgi:hypothetical protein
MPNWLQVITSVIPLLYILSVIQAIVHKGMGLQVLRPQVLASAVFGAGIVLLAASRFEKRLE